MQTAPSTASAIGRAWIAWRRWFYTNPCDPAYPAMVAEYEAAWVAVMAAVPASLSELKGKLFLLEWRAQGYRNGNPIAGHVAAHECIRLARQAARDRAPDLAAKVRLAASAAELAGDSAPELVNGMHAALAGLSRLRLAKG